MRILLPQFPRAFRSGHLGNPALHFMAAEFALRIEIPSTCVAPELVCVWTCVRRHNVLLHLRSRPDVPVSCSSIGPEGLLVFTRRSQVMGSDNRNCFRKACRRVGSKCGIAQSLRQDNSSAALLTSQTTLVMEAERRPDNPFGNVFRRVEPWEPQHRYPDRPPSRPEASVPSPQQ